MAETTGAVLEVDPGLQVERWAMEQMDLLIVPPLSWQASLYIHLRVLSVHSRIPPSPMLVGGGVGGGLSSTSKVFL